MATAVDTRVGRTLRLQSWLHAALGVAGLTVAVFLIYPKVHRLINGDPHVIGRGALANLALLFGSLMFLRNARYFWRRVASIER